MQVQRTGPLPQQIDVLLDQFADPVPQPLHPARRERRSQQLSDVRVVGLLVRAVGRHMRARGRGGEFAVLVRVVGVDAD
ncbi:hypothetical protein [Nocardia sp. N2S4-5]|uniref:hypothetical protein n=1 Tax=Nocardia sp. N2S4-5 TaxID=3351565 RepID=UPI0037D7D8B9